MVRSNYESCSIDLLLICLLNTNNATKGDSAFVGVYRRSPDIKYFIDINAVVDLHKWSLRRSRLAIGANISINDTMDILLKVAADKEDFSYCREMAKHLDLVATDAVRNVSSKKL